MKKIMSKFLQLNWNDLFKGAVLTVLASVISVIGTCINNAIVTGNIAIDWQIVFYVALSAFIGYIGKQLGTDQNGKTFGIKI